ncbi:hypothetical protein PR048_005297 [Dryococelus australis]|uniref:Uncharacterized protein n=1 Tax=Dryococelus australis TaxID=614101 RepID=A0ABQ9I8Q1_9NEOP|nr:hypothetical protein PR048_005297 [Dryococelus australis]
MQLHIHPFHFSCSCRQDNNYNYSNYAIKIEVPSPTQYRSLQVPSPRHNPMTPAKTAPQISGIATGERWRNTQGKGAARREYCTPVQSPACSGDDSFDASGSVVLIALAFLGLKRENELHVDEQERVDVSCLCGSVVSRTMQDSEKFCLSLNYLVIDLLQLNWEKLTDGGGNYRRILRQVRVTTSACSSSRLKSAGNVFLQSFNRHCNCHLGAERENTEANEAGTALPAEQHVCIVIVNGRWYSRRGRGATDGGGYLGLHLFTHWDGAGLSATFRFFNGSSEGRASLDSASSHHDITPMDSPPTGQLLGGLNSYLLPLKEIRRARSSLLTGCEKDAQTNYNTAHQNTTVVDDRTAVDDPSKEVNGAADDTPEEIDGDAAASGIPSEVDDSTALTSGLNHSCTTLVSDDEGHGSIAFEVRDRPSYSQFSFTANRDRVPVGSLQDFRMWESCRTMLLAGGFSWGCPVSPPLISGAAPYTPKSPSLGLTTSMARITCVAEKGGFWDNWLLAGDSRTHAEILDFPEFLQKNTVFFLHRKRSKSPEMTTRRAKFREIIAHLDFMLLHCTNDPTLLRLTQRGGVCGWIRTPCFVNLVHNLRNGPRPLQYSHPISLSVQHTQVNITGQALARSTHVRVPDHVPGLVTPRTSLLHNPMTVLCATFQTIAGACCGVSYFGHSCYTTAPKMGIREAASSDWLDHGLCYILFSKSLTVTPECSMSPHRVLIVSVVLSAVLIMTVVVIAVQIHVLIGVLILIAELSAVRCVVHVCRPKVKVKSQWSKVLLSWLGVTRPRLRSHECTAPALGKMGIFRDVLGKKGQF